MVVGLESLTKETLIRILTEPKNAVLRQFQRFFSLDGVELVFTQDALEACADEAIRHKTGARGLRTVLEDTLLDVMYEVPSRSDVREVHRQRRHDPSAPPPAAGDALRPGDSARRRRLRAAQERLGLAPAQRKHLRGRAQRPASSLPRFDGCTRAPYNSRMEAPPVQYVRTSDGRDIAYAVSGQGRPVIWMPHLFSHIQVYWSEQTFVRSWLEQLASHFQLVQYDGRGQGMSSRGLSPDHTLEDSLRDLEAVVDRLKLERFVLIALGWAGHASLRYAVANPGRVEALVLQASPIHGVAFNTLLFGLMAEQDWDAFLRVIAAQGLPQNVAASISQAEADDHAGRPHGHSTRLGCI